MNNMEKDRRNDVIIKLRKTKTLREIGAMYGLTRQRISQICDMLGVARRRTTTPKKVWVVPITDYHDRNISLRDVMRITRFGHTVVILEERRHNIKLRRDKKPAVHGTRSMYGNGKCRCAACTEANTVSCRKFQQERRAKCQE